MDFDFNFNFVKRATIESNCDPDEGTSDGRTAISNGSKVTIKRESGIKEEELSDGTRIDVTRQQIELDAAIAVNLGVKSESDTMVKVVRNSACKCFRWNERLQLTQRL